MENIVSSVVIGVVALACLYVIYNCKDTDDWEDIAHDLQETNHKQLELINELNAENKELHNSNQALRKELMGYIAIVIKLTGETSHESGNQS
jgi:hypothetical protein